MSLLEKFRESHPRSQPVPESTDMPMSSSLEKALSSAAELNDELQGKEVTPSHLLAAAMRTSQTALRALRDAGITEEEVVKAIRDEDAG